MKVPLRYATKCLFHPIFEQCIKGNNTEDNEKSLKDQKNEQTVESLLRMLTLMSENVGPLTNTNLGLLR